MMRIRFAGFAARVLGCTVVLFSPAPAWTAAAPALQTRTPASALRIVVIEGEDAVNIVQQRTAVAPVVEVRDRNNQPVAGAAVRFTVRGGRATFGGGARALSVTTNAAGQAAATGLTPTASGAVQISVSAAFEGETAVATIVQTNVLTAAQTAGTGAAGAGSSPGGAAAAGAGAGAAIGTGVAASGGAAGAGGLSATTIGIVGGAAAGGTLVAVKAAAGGSDSDNAPTLGPASGLYSGTVRLSAVRTAQSSGLIGQVGAVGNTCTWTLAIAVTLTLDLDEYPINTVATGHFETSWTQSEVSRSCPGTQPVGGTYGPQTDDINGQSTSNLYYRRVDTGSPPEGGTQTIVTAFSGALSGDTVSGTFSIERSYAFPQRGINENQTVASGPVVLQKRGR